MTRFTRTLFFPLVLLFACPAPTTSVRLRLDYDDAWPLSSFVVSARDRMVRIHSSASDGTKTREIVVSVANDWAGEPIVYTVRAYTGTPGREELYASGHTTVTAIEGEVTDEVIVFARSACATWCTPGSTFCRNGGVMVCEMSETGCPRWGTPALCSDGQSCSLGECNTQCVNECAEGETRCSGPLGVEICGQSDNDSCLDWQQPILCEGAQICSNGRCSDSCMSECTAGSVRCRDGGVSTCADSNSDGCLEWGPSVSCAAGESCAGTEGMPNAAGVAHCQARTSCTDSCTTNTCVNNTFTTCGNFNLDSCREPSAGTNCASANPCEEGVCDLTANGGMGGCVIRPRNTPECTGQCAGQAENSSCNDNEACTTGDSCRSGLCTGTPMNCTAGREPTCENGVARTYTSAGMCMNGTCQYSIASEETCANGCEGTRCAIRPATVTAIAVGGYHEYDRFFITTQDDTHVCALLSTGSVRCVGDNGSGQLGDGGHEAQERPVTVLNLTNATAIAAGDHHTCALRADRTVHCWGSNFYHQAPQDPGLTDAIAIAASDDVSCALRADQTVSCWGHGWGRLSQVPGVNFARGLADVYCALVADQARCWRDGESAQVVAGLTGVAAGPTSGREQMCARLENGTVHCWGKDCRLNPLAPGPIASLAEVRSISAGSDHTCALLNDRSVACWGRNRWRQLSESQTLGCSDEAVPSPLFGNQVVAISAGAITTCALLEDQSVRCMKHGSVETYSFLP